MDKQKQIEEMAKMITESCCELFANHNCGVSCAECIATDIYKAGYRKIPENAVVLTPAERDEEMRLIREDVIERMEATRKETAEKFKALLEGTVPQGLLDEICKELEGENG